MTEQEYNFNLTLSQMLSPENFPTLKNNAILEAAWGRTPHRTPVWVMRQAGRYLPEFRELRKHHDFFEIVNTPELASTVTLQPIHRYDLDAAIIFSDILVIPQALGMIVKMEPGVGPVLPNPLKCPDDANKLDYDADVTDKMKGTLNSITMTRHKLGGKVPLIGFSGAPWTLLSYMIEGGGSRTLAKAKSWLYKYPVDSLSIMFKIGEMVTRYLVEQVAAGAQMLQIFESHADLLGPELFNTFCLPVLTKVESDVNRIIRERGLQPVPMVLFAKGAHYALKELSQTAYNVIGVDWTIDPHLARDLIGSEKVIQGNLDPCALYAPKKILEDKVRVMVDGFTTKHYICNLGHGIYPDAPTESVQYLIDTVHSCKI